MFIPILMLVVGLAMLIKGGDWFVDGATGIARRFRVPEIMIGATVVAIGTTLPEILVSSNAAMRGSGSIAYGNAIGSIICNTALIAAITIAIKPGPVMGKSMSLPVGFFFGSAVFYCIIAYFFGKFTIYSGIILLLIATAYIVSSVIHAKKAVDTISQVIGNEEPATEEEIESISGEDHVVESKKDKTQDSLLKDILLLVVGAVLIAFGADFLVDNSIIIAREIGISEKVIGLTIIAFGTSLPEFVTAITSLIKGHGSLSLGNIIGANIFNLVLVSGVAITINPFDVPQSAAIGGINSSLLIDIPVMFLVSVILTIPTLMHQKLSRWQGISLLCIYVAFCAVQFIV